MASTPYTVASNLPSTSHHNNKNMTNWVDLRKQARQIENELEMKLVSFSKLGTHHQSHHRRVEEKESLLGSTEHIFESMSSEIERLLSRLTSINDEMSSYLSEMSIGETNAAQMHTMQRHRDILQDYSHEYAKTQANIKATQDREDLLGSVRRDISDYKSSLSRRTDLYLKENEHLRNSDRATDETIEMALATKENLASQRNRLQSMTVRVLSLGNRFPAINNMFKKINLRQRRDTIIMACVISFCLIVLMLFAFR